MTQPTLDPCPNCKGKASLDVVYGLDRTDPKKPCYSIECPFSNECEIYPTTNFYLTKRSAIKAWKKIAGKNDEN
jgi:hypothetical protein